jgi:hypothetical protein
MPFHPTMIYQFGWKYLSACFAALRLAKPNYCMFLLHAVDMADFSNHKDNEQFSNLVFTKWSLENKIKLNHSYIDFCKESGMSYMTCRGYINAQTSITRNNN